MSSASVEIAACPVCDGSSLESIPIPRRIVAGDRWSACEPPLGLRRCRGCAFVFVSPRPSPADLDQFYRAADYTAHEPIGDAAALRRADLQLDAIAGWGGRLVDAAVLDIGCGGGQFLAQARRRGARVMGFDVGPHALAACERQGIAATSDPRALVAGSYDGIMMSHVFEHLAEPLETLRWCWDLLRPGGWLCLEVPNVASLRAMLSSPALAAPLGLDERYRAFPIHVSYFTADTLQRALARSGFGAVRCTTVGLGLDGLRAGSDDQPRAGPAPAPAAGDGAMAGRRRVAGAGSARVRAALKRVYFGSLLGENLIGFARRA